MGNIFKYIADDALEAEDASYYKECQVCQAVGVPVYSCQGRVARAGGVLKDVYVVCAKCLNRGQVKHISEWGTDRVIKAYVNNFYLGANPEFIVEKENELILALRKTPELTWIYEDWPLCCGDLTEYSGYPKTVAELEKTKTPMIFWEGAVKEPFVYFGHECQPESFEEVSFFQCLHCAKCYWTYAPT